MEDDIQQLRGLIPKIITNLVRDCKNKIDIPITKEINAGVIFTDVKSFTKLTETTSKNGYYSVEIIIDILNSYFDLMYNIIDHYNGDLVKYGGDSLQAIFPGSEEDVIPIIESCLKSMKSSLILLNKTIYEKYSVEIDFHHSSGWGKLNVHIVGSQKYHLDYYFTGEVLDRTFSISDLYEIETSDDYILKDVNKAKNDDLSSCSDKFIHPKVTDWLTLNSATGELRDSVTIFLSLKDIGDKEDIPIESFNSYYKQVQDIVYYYDGLINKIDYSDKGYVVLISFGLPNTHQDDIQRAFVCSKRIVELPSMFIKSKIGLTYNKVFAGILGAKNRFEYGIIGNAVNIAARLMNESEYGKVTFSKEILEHLVGRFETELLKRVKVKGIAEDISIFHITKEISDTWDIFNKRYANVELLGYDDITSLFKPMINIVYGESGSGKSLLTHTYLKHNYVSNDVFLFSLSEHDGLRPLNLVYQLFNIKLNITNIINDRLIIKDFIDQNDLHVSYQLIEDYLLKRDDKINLGLIIDIFSEMFLFLLKDYKVFVIDNYQWLDQFSKLLCSVVVSKLSNLGIKIILTSRDKSDVKDLDKCNPALFRTKKFTENITRSLAKSLEIKISNQAISNLLDLTDRNPAYTVDTLRIIKSNWDNNRAIFNLADLNQLIQKNIIPKSYENLLLNQFEKLSQESKSILKYASIIGVSFSNSMIKKLTDKQINIHIEDVLIKLSADKYILEKKMLPEVEYLFNNKTMREAIYRTILHKEKKSMHVKIAEFYINNFSDNQYEYYEIIANHYILADIKAEIAFWCKLAAEKNYSISAFVDSSYYYKIAIDNTLDKSIKNSLRLEYLELLLIRGDVSEIKEILKVLRFDKLRDFQQDRYLQNILRFYELKKDFKRFSSVYAKALKKIKSLEILNRIRLTALDFYRACSLDDEFIKTRDMLNSEEKSLSIVNKILLNSVQGQFYLDKANYENAKYYYSKLLDLAIAENKKLYIRIAYTSLGTISIRTGNPQLAIDYYSKAYKIAEEIGDKNGYSKVLTELAMIQFAEGQDQKAQENLEVCLKIARYIGDRQQEHTVLYNMGYIKNVINEPNQSCDFLNKAKLIAEEIGDRVGVTFCNDGLGDAFFMQGKIDKAKYIYEQNLKIQEELNDIEGIAHTIGNLANVYREKKDFEKAVEYYSRQQSSLNQIGDVIGEGKALFNWGITLEITKNIQAGIEKLSLANQLFLKAKDKNFTTITQQQLDRMKSKVQ